MNSYQAEDVFAILVSQNTYVKTAPSLNAANQFIIHEGLKFEIIDMVDGWSRVLLSDGKDGWVENNHFLKIN
jgi:SH3-like domain-containing protein